MDKSTLLKELNTITTQLIEKYNPDKNGRQTIDMRLRKTESIITKEFKSKTMVAVIPACRESFLFVRNRKKRMLDNPA